MILSSRRFGKDIIFSSPEGVAVPEIAVPLKIFISSSSDFCVQGPHLIIAKHLPARSTVLFLSHSQGSSVSSGSWRHNLCKALRQQRDLPVKWQREGFKVG